MTYARRSTPLTKKLLLEFLEERDAPCISLYMPTARTHPDNLQNPVRFKNLVKKLETSLLLKYSKDETQAYLDQLTGLVSESDFWNYTTEGIAMFSGPGLTKFVDLAQPVEEMAIVADSFHTKPLMKYLQSTDRFQVLALNQHEIKLYEGNRHWLTQIQFEDEIPETITEALGEELTDGHLTVASYGGAGAKSTNMFHGHGSKKDETEIDAERYFRAVSNSIAEHYSKPGGLPLILAALPEHHNLFHKVSKNPMLLKEGIRINPDSISEKKLAELAWEVMEPEYVAKQEELANRFHQAKADKAGSDDIKEVAVAIVEGRVDTLLVEADRIIAKRITNLVTGNTQKKDLNNPKVDDLLDDMSELVLKMGGDVFVLPPERMPSETGVAAIYRY